MDGLAADHAAAAHAHRVLAVDSHAGGPAWRGGGASGARDLADPLADAGRPPEPQRVRCGKPVQHGRHPPGLHGLSLVWARERRAPGVEASGSLVERPRGAAGLPQTPAAAVDLSRLRRAPAPAPCPPSPARRTRPRMHIEPFRIAVPDAVLADLRERLARTRFPDEIPASGGTYGTNLAYLPQLVAYWRERFDWRAAEAR